MLNIGQSQAHKVAHSLRFGIDFESNKSLDFYYPTVDFSNFPYSQSVRDNSTEINGFSFQVGWNFQFHTIKRKK